MIVDAVESATEVDQVVDSWRVMFGEGATILPGMGGDVLWHPSYSVWGAFHRLSGADEGSRRHWIPFGRVPVDFRRNILVEINPTPRGTESTVQGVIGRTRRGERWILHRAQLRGARISPDIFDRAVPERKRVRVRFSNGETRAYHAVANVDSTPRTLLHQIAKYVTDCERARIYYVAGERVAEAQARVDTAETQDMGPGSSSPEKGGAYDVGPRDPIRAWRYHADVWRALTEELTRLGVRWSNGRVGRHGPDLRTLDGHPFLFEIKTDDDTPSIYEGIGQLFLYEKLLGSEHKKVLVLPSGGTGPLVNAIRALGILILAYERKRRQVTIESAQLERWLQG